MRPLFPVNRSTALSGCLTALAALIALLYWWTNQNAASNIKKGASERSAPAHQGHFQNTSDLFAAKDFAYAEGSCKKEELQAETSYGNWYTVSDCVLPARANRPGLSVDTALFSKDGRITGVQRMLIDEKLRAQFLALNNGTFSQSTESCTQIGKGSFPLLTAVRKPLCDALAYDQL